MSFHRYFEFVVTDTINSIPGRLLLLMRYVNQEKFPEGLKPLIYCVKDLGMDFGLWIEPEIPHRQAYYTGDLQLSLSAQIHACMDHRRSQRCQPESAPFLQSPLLYVRSSGNLHESQQSR